MTSYLPFSIISHPPPSQHLSDDPHLQIIVTPSASAFYAGETFSATIILRNTLSPSTSTPNQTPNSSTTLVNTRRNGHEPYEDNRINSNIRPPASAQALSNALAHPPTTASPASSSSHPSPLGHNGRRKQVGLSINSTLQQQDLGGPSRLPKPLSLASPVPKEFGTLYSPGANPSFRAGWPAEQLSPIRSPGWRSREGHLGSSSRGKENGQGHTRQTRSLALGKTMSPQEMIWALGGQTPPPPLPRRSNGAGIPSSHPHSRKISNASNGIVSPPPSEPLSLFPSLLDSIPEGVLSLDRNASKVSHSLENAFESTEEIIGDSHHPSSRRAQSFPSRLSSVSGPSSTNQSMTVITDEELILSDPKTVPHRTTSPSSLGPRRSPSVSPSPSLAPLPQQTQSVSAPIHSRTPSYHNAYGALLTPTDPASASSSTLPPPTHPSLRRTGSRSESGSTKILWAHTRLVAHFTPSNAYIPPDPLLPLRARMLHQPVGSGALVASPRGSTSSAESGSRSGSGSRWQLSFGTGAIGGGQHPSLTGSLLGLAKDLVYGGGGGTLEEERKRVWNMKDLPVLETTRSLLGIDMELQEGESRQFVYTFPLPSSLPPTYRGKSVKFSYELIISINVALPGGTNRQRSKDVSIPIRVWSNVSLSNPLRTYDVLHPIIQTTEQGRVVNASSPNPAKESASLGLRGSNSASDATSSTGNRRNMASQDTLNSLESYARHLLDTLEPESEIEKEEHSRNENDCKKFGEGQNEHDANRISLSRPRSRLVPVSPSRSTRPSRPLSPSLPVKSPVLEPSASIISDLENVSSLSLGGEEKESNETEDGHPSIIVNSGGDKGVELANEKPRISPKPLGGKTSQVFIDGDDELVDGIDEPGSGEAVEILSRHSPKMSYDIAKDGEIVAVLTLVKTTYRLGETVLGIVKFNQPLATRRVLRLSAYLETHELIPEALLPPSASSSGRARQPQLTRMHADFSASYVVQTSRITFSLDIPSDATPAFRLRAGEEGADGGLEWKVRLSFLVVSDPGRPRRHVHDHGHEHGQESNVNGSKRRTPSAMTMTNVVEVPSHDSDNRIYVATTTLAPVIRHGSSDAGDGSTSFTASGKEDTNGLAVGWEEARTEIVECMIPIQVLAGNTAFVVRPLYVTV